MEQNSKGRQRISQCKSREKMEQRTRPCTLPCKVRGSFVISAETRMNLYANLGSKANLTSVSCYQGEIPSFYCTYYLLLQGVEQQPAIRRNWSSQARIFCRYLGTNSGLCSLLACHLLLSICQHPFQSKKPNDLSTKTWLQSNPFTLKVLKHQYLLLEKQSCKCGNGHPHFSCL